MRFRLWKGVRSLVSKLWLERDLRTLSLQVEYDQGGRGVYTYSQGGRGVYA